MSCAQRHCGSGRRHEMGSRGACFVSALLTVLTLQAVSANDYRSDGFMDHLNTGIKLAQNLLGSESVALKVADFVVRAFRPAAAGGGRRPGGPVGGEEEPQAPGGEQPQTPGAAPWRQLLRLLGLRPHQISAVAVNALVFVAQMITTFLANPRGLSKPYRSDDPIDWILNKNSTELQQLIATAKNDSLTDLIEDLVDQHHTREETSCIRLLVCKITPFVSRMQRAVFGKESAAYVGAARGAGALQRHLPDPAEINERSEVCEKRFQDCNLNE